MQTSDTSWHALEGLTQGIIHMVAEVEYGGDYGDAHTLMDNGGDVVGAYLFDMSYADQWYIPSDDLYNILVRYQGDDDGLTPESFETCGSWMHLLRSAEELEAAALLYPSFAETSPALLDELEVS